MHEKSLVLIAEDDRQIQSLLQESLQKEYHLIFAKDGLQAFEFVKQYSPDLIIMDLHMPKLTGWQAIQEIRVSGKKLPIIVVSGFHDVYNERKAEKYGIVGFLYKPFSMDHLKQLIQENIGSSEKLMDQEKEEEG
jgi:CheY-like chemotaxis protein